MSGEVTRHGMSGYRLGCRCDICRKGNSEYQKDWRQRKNKTVKRRRNSIDADLNPPTRRKAPQLEHGTRTMFVSGCRCDPCRDASRAYHKEWRQKRIEAHNLPNDPDEWFLGINEGDTSWMERGACKDPKIPTSWFFPHRGSNKAVDRAKTICAGCEVKEECLAYAIRTHQRMGIWGGVAGKDIRTLSAQHRRGEVA